MIQTRKNPGSKQALIAFRARADKDDRAHRVDRQHFCRSSQLTRICLFASLKGSEILE
jgi:hypothetical protein